MPEAFRVASLEVRLKLNKLFLARLKSYSSITEQTLSGAEKPFKESKKLELLA
jgi:hypothetical protein